MPLTSVSRPPTVSQLARQLRVEIAGLPRITTLLSCFLGRADHEFAGLDAITDSLRDDPALVEWILRQANSGLYHQQRPLATLAEAGVVLGLEAVTRLTYAACTQVLLPVNPRPYRGDRRTTSLHAMAVSCATADLALSLGPPSPLSPAAARLAGLIHDVGKRLVATRWNPRWGPPQGLEHEWQAVGFDHATASAAIADTWGLPPAIVSAVAGHHDPGSDAGAALLAAADALMIEWKVGPAMYPRMNADTPVGPFAELLGDLAPTSDALHRWVARMPAVVDGLDEMLRWSERPAPPELPGPAEEPPPLQVTRTSSRGRRRRRPRGRR